MKTLYLDCGMGAAGDMLTAALLELLPEPDTFMEKLNGIGLRHVVFEKTAASKCGITGTHMHVLVDGREESEILAEHDHAHDHHHDHDHEHDHHEHHHEHHHDHEHHSLASIKEIIDGLNVSEKVKGDILAVYQMIAEAEAHVHNREIHEIHFHEVGTLDAVADVAAVCLLMEQLAPEQVITSPVHVGSGTVQCAHGILPVPAPATAFILRDVPIYGGEIRGELCTPTGAALLKYFTNRFGKMPVMRTEAIGYGMGNKDFPIANCVRAMLGETDSQDSETMLELSVNIDDMTAEQLAYAMERIYEAGAVEVFTSPIGMKKSRPGTLLHAICSSDRREAVVEAFFRHTSTIGIRETETRRYVLKRQIREVKTSFGTVHVKYSEGYGVTRKKPEYEDLARIAREKGLSLAEVRETVMREIS